jgi:5-methylcytosine-specific restriction endonuclease McrA
MPMDKQSKDLLTPFLSSNQEQRILTSGHEATTRSVSGTKKKWIAAEQGWKCNSCQTQLDAWFEVDHKIRLADGGSNHVDNLVALCRNCHGKKTTLENL